MTEPNELRFDDLEKRVTKIEEDIRCNKEAKEQQWKNNLNKKLENIEDMVKTVDIRLQQGQKTAKGQWIYNASLTAVIFAGGITSTATIISAITDEPISTSYTLPALIIFILGVIGGCLYFRYMRTKHSNE